MAENARTTDGVADGGPVRGVSPSSGLRRRLGDFLRPPVDSDELVAGAPPLTLGQIARRFAPDVRPYRWHIGLKLLLGAAVTGISLAEIALFARVVDDVLVPQTMGPLLWLALAYVGLSLASGVLSGFRDYLSTWISHTFLLTLRTKVFRHVMSLPSEVHDRRRVGDVMARLTSDVSSVETFMIAALSRGVTAVISVVMYVCALFWLDWVLAAVSLVVVPVFWAVATTFSRYVKVTSRETRRRGGSLSAVAEEHLGNTPLVQAFNREDDAVERFHRQNAGIRDASLAASRVRAIFLPVVDLAELVGILSVIAMGAWALSEDRLTLGGLLAFLTMMAQLYGPLRDLADLLPTLFSASAGVERLVELLDEEAPQDAPGAGPLRILRGDVALRGVGVTYPRATRPAVRDLDLHVPAGQVLAVVGASGAGKSTLLRLLVRALDPTTGQVLIDGQDLRDVTAASVREQVSYVPQEAALLDASVRENIAFARPDASDDDIRAAARAADADGFIQALPQGYDSPLGQRARTLSGGQRQRLTIARALLRDTPLLLLDEPTTGLDPDSARRILEPLRTLTRGRTTILVTHDPVALEIADRVVHLADGALTAPGSNLEVTR